MDFVSIVLFAFLWYLVYDIKRRIFMSIFVNGVSE